MGKTSIEWCRTYLPDGKFVEGYTFNPWWGCVEDGPECDHCYARAFAKRVGQRVWGHDSPRRFFGDLYWREPLLWNKQAEKTGVRRKVFVASMADIGERRNDETGARMDGERSKLWQLIELCTNLDWLLLTKRPQNLIHLVPEPWNTQGYPPHMWVGTTAGDQSGLDKRAKYLARIPAAIRFLSCEPLLSQITLGNIASPIQVNRCQVGALSNDGERALLGIVRAAAKRLDPGRVDWVIAGSESGAGARPAERDWIRSLRDQCQASGTLFFFKQWTEHRKVISTPELDGRQWIEQPETRVAPRSLVAPGTTP